MSCSRVGQGNQSPLSSTSNGTSSKKKKDRKNDNPKNVYNSVKKISDDEVETHLQPSEERLMTETEFNAKMSAREQVFEARLKTFMDVLDNKDKIISELSTRVGK